jgi:hypothetical protein
MGRRAGVVLLLLVLAGAVVIHAADRPTRIHLSISDRSEIQVLTRLVSIDDVRGLEVWAYASPRQLEALAKAGYAWREEPEVWDGQPRAACPAGWDTNPARPWDCYPTYAQYVGFLQYETTNHAAIARLVDLGPTTNTTRPHQLYAVKISDNPDSAEDEPEVLYASSMHGDETTGYVLTLRLIDELLTGYGSDPELTAMVDDLEIWINPLHNPDGTYFGSDTSVDGAIRDYTTASGSGYGPDPNRNFPDPDDGPHPDGEPYWLETQNMMSFADAHRFVIAANFHGGAEVVNYPWDTWARLHVDDDWLVNVSRAYADQVHLDGPAGYLTDYNNGITNGYAWYEVQGGRQDFMTYWHGCREVTIELSSTKLPPSSQLPTFWTANRQALHNWLNESLEGIRGVVTSSAGGPVDATIEVVGHDSAVDNSYVYTDPEVGDYHRMLLPGTYTLRFSAYAHETQDVAGIVVTSGPATRVDVVMQQLPTFVVSGLVTTPDGKGAIAAATVEILGTPLAPATTAGDGSYLISNVLPDIYTFRVSASGHETIEVERTVAAGSTVQDFVLAPLQVSFATDLEASDGGLVATPGTGWQWGIPSGSSPAAHSGSKLWATTLAGSYASSAQWYLDLDATVPAASPRLSFWHWYQFETGYSDYDGGNLSVSTDGGSTWALLTPDGGYPCTSITALAQPGYGRSSDGWEEAFFDLASYAGQSVRLRWHFGSDSSVTELGWYVDDISLAGVSYAADFDWTPLSPEAGETVHFKDRSSGPGQAWSWVFGDGGTSSEQNPDHVYLGDGTCEVTLEVTLDGGGTLLRVEHVTVGQAGLIFEDGFNTGGTGAWSTVNP